MVNFEQKWCEISQKNSQKNYKDLKEKNYCLERENERLHYALDNILRISDPTTPGLHESENIHAMNSEARQALNKQPVHISDYSYESFGGQVEITYQDQISTVLKLLSGNLNYDQVAEAKEYLKIVLNHFSAENSKCRSCGCECLNCGCSTGCCVKCGCCKKQN